MVYGRKHNKTVPLLNPSRIRSNFIAGLTVFTLVLSPFRGSTEPPEILLPGYRPNPPGVHALVGAHVVVKPGETLDKATIIIRDGMIQAVGPDVAIPPDARVWDLAGQTIYAGFIDPYLTLGGRTPAASGHPTEEEVDSSDDLRAGGSVKFFGLAAQERDPAGPGYEVSRISPDHRVALTYSPDPKAIEKIREIGFTSGNVVPESGILRGISAFVSLSDAEPNRTVIRPAVFQHVAFEMEGRRGGYPGSLMGMIAVVRQSFFDAQHYALDQADYRKHSSERTRPEYNPGAEALGPALEKKMTVVFQPEDALMVGQATRIAHEIDLNYYILATGQEWRRPELAKAAGVPFIVPLNYPAAPKLPTEEDSEEITLDELRAWDWASENPAVLQNQGLELALTTATLRDRGSFRKNLKLAIDRGLSESNALAALTIVPAKLCGVDSMLGTIEKGKVANLTICDGKGYFDTDSKVKSVWIDGRFFRADSDEKEKDDSKSRGADKKDPEKEPGGADTSVATTTNKVDSATTDTNKVDSAADTNKVETASTDRPRSGRGGRGGRGGRSARNKEPDKLIAHSPLEGRHPLTDAPVVLVKNATIWTLGPQGILTNAEMLIIDGKIAALGHDLLSGRDLAGKTNLTIDANGEQISPGIIDCHSHSAILGGVNEGSLPSTAMVRIGDVVNSETRNLYYQLAGGVTMANLLHGSANPIGGQNCVIKFRDGELPEQLKFAPAPQGIKFALGENVKQSNGGGRGGSARYPQTRMGVRSFFANRFTAAKEYLKKWDDYKKAGVGVPPARDLELEAIGEIIEGKRLIHCHSYVQDEILSLIRLMEDFGVKIATFQHVLEGYKVADEIAKHGAGGSTFSDWWAYKFEVYDAIQYNGSLMHDRGVVVTFNSDSDDLARRLYLEAAKAVKYGGTPEIEALEFVTLNAAKQLHIDKYVGSLEPGKDADFAIWSKSPLDTGTVCQQTWIDGKKYFDVSLAPERATALAKERTDLLAKMKKMSGGGRGGPPSDDKPDDGGFFRKSLETQYDGLIRHCNDE